MNDRTQVAERDQEVVARRNSDQPARRTTLTPAVDIFEDSQGITLWADLPGVTKDQLDVKVHDGNLYIEAKAVVPTPAGLGCSTPRSENRTLRAHSHSARTLIRQRSMQTCRTAC
jgi:hypothetical protein